MTNDECLMTNVAAWREGSSKSELVIRKSEFRNENAPLHPSQFPPRADASLIRH